MLCNPTENQHPSQLAGSAWPKTAQTTKPQTAENLAACSFSTAISCVQERDAYAQQLEELVQNMESLLQEKEQSDRQLSEKEDQLDALRRSVRELEDEVQSAGAALETAQSESDKVRLVDVLASLLHGRYLLHACIVEF